jgi:hypothetical protein
VILDTVKEHIPAVRDQISWGCGLFLSS